MCGDDGALMDKKNAMKGFFTIIKLEHFQTTEFFKKKSYLFRYKNFVLLKINPQKSFEKKNFLENGI